MAEKQTSLSAGSMRVVIDTNIVFSALLNRKSNIGEIILNSQESFVFYGCESLKEEIRTYKEKIMRLADYDPAAYEEVESLVFEQILFISESAIPFEYWHNAALFVNDIDMDDIAFVAMSLYFGINIWTGDKQLMNGLIKKGFQNLITTSEMLRLRNTEG
ncbi:MAG: hypothetical protein IAE84_16035 [Saprospiraceae bacterium]|nr:hypothetical protein [Saprospiraceae bacterium]